MLVRKLVKNERTHTIVLYFSLSASVFSLATLPFGWPSISREAFLLLMVAGFCGGVAQILLTESYRHADMSTIAPFEYTSLVWAFGLGFLIWGDVPAANVFAGAGLIFAAGLLIIVGERLAHRRAGAAA
ncbi:hypothetical protein D9M70_595810 [compost metagenome]